MPQAARNWAETGALLCEVLAAELEQHRRRTPQAALASLAAPSQVSAGQDVSSLQQVPYNRCISNGKSGAHDQLELLDLGRCPASAEKLAPRDMAQGPLAPCFHALQMSHNDIAAQSVSAVTQTHPASSPALPEEDVARSGDAHRPQSCIDWPEIAPADQTAGHKTIPEPPAEFASVLCATWHALAPEMTYSDTVPGRHHAAEQERGPSMSQNPPPQQSSGCRDRDEHGVPSSKRQRVARSPADSEADPGSAATEAAAGVTSTGRHAAGDQQHTGPQELGLDFRLLGEPAGFMSCQAQPSSRPDLRAALKAELAISGLSLLIISRLTLLSRLLVCVVTAVSLLRRSTHQHSCCGFINVLKGCAAFAGTEEEELDRLEHIAHGAATCQAHAAGLLQVGVTVMSL